jgi:hypothetical protein
MPELGNMTEAWSRSGLSRFPVSWHFLLSTVIKIARQASAKLIYTGPGSETTSPLCHYCGEAWFLDFEPRESWLVSIRYAGVVQW